MSRSSHYKIWAVLTLVSATLLVCAAAGQEKDSLVGQWKMVSSTSDGGEIPWTLTIHSTGGTYSATAAVDEGESEAKNFKVDGDNVSMLVNYHGDEYEIKLKHAGQKLTGTWSGNGDSGDTKGERASSST